MGENEFEVILNKLFKHFQVGTISALAEKLDTTHSTISRWRSRKNFNPLIKKLYELDIYDEIMEGNIQVMQKNIGINAQNNYGEQTQQGSTTSNEVDSATLALFHEAYKKAISNDKLNEFRIMLMKFE